MIEYHVYGQVMGERYYFVSDFDDSYYQKRWYMYQYPIYKNTTEDYIFNRIKYINEIINHSSKDKLIEEIFFYKEEILFKDILVKRKFPINYKEIKTINVDLELRDGNLIQIENEDYRVKYKYNDDKKQNELYIDKIVEIIVDKEELKHAKEVCNGVVKKIIKHNREIKKKEQLKLGQTRFKDVKLTKILRDWFKR